MRQPLLPPGPKGLPWLGSLLDIAGDRLDFFERNQTQYGDVVRFRLGSRHVYQLTNPVDIEAVLVGRQHHFHKGNSTRLMSATLGNGLLTSEGELWRHQRKLIAPSFQPRQIEGYARTMVEESLATAAGLADGAMVDVHPKMMQLTLRVILRTLFGEGADGAGRLERLGAIMAGLIEEYEAYNFTWQLLLPGWAPLGAPARAKRLLVELDELFAEIIRSRAGHPPGDDILSRLQAATSGEGEGMTARQLQDEMVTFFAAGHETTAMALTYALHLLSLHPEIASRLREELGRVAGERALEASDVPKLKLCDAVIKEAMRLYPPAWMIGRAVVTDCPLRGWLLPAGARVLLPQWVVHRDARWYDEPLAFRPDRWLDGLAQRLPPCAYFPFGGGPRSCVGGHFATLELVLVLATLCQRIQVEPVPGFELELLPLVTLRPSGGLPLRVRRRGTLSHVAAA